MVNANVVNAIEIDNESISIFKIENYLIIIVVILNFFLNFVLNIYALHSRRLKKICLSRANDLDKV